MDAKAMTSSQHGGHLGSAYDAKSVDDIARLYDSWSESYDAEMARFGYRHPAIALALLARHVPKGAAPLLDAGCGTGLVGEWLGIAGYPNVEGLDISEGMLAHAARKNCYAKLHRLALGETLPFADGRFAAVIASGVFTTGHVGVSGLDELIRACATGGVLVVTVKMAVWEQGFADQIAVREIQGRITRIDETMPYVSMPGEQGTSPSKAIVLQVAQAR